VDAEVDGLVRQPMADGDDLEDIEVALLLEGVFRCYGFDFRGYAPGVLKRRLQRRVGAERVGTVSRLQDRVLRDPACFHRLAADLSINVTSMFRDPGFYLAFRERVVPLLRTYPSLRIWNAGCSTGEEVFSVAIVLREEGLADRTRIYATDITDSALDRARAGEFPLRKMPAYTSNYLASGGKRAFSSYYRANSITARFDSSLVENVVFARHNLVCDGVFNEFNAIFCRNVLIYFGHELKERVQRLLGESLGPFGVIALGVRDSWPAGGYRRLDHAHRIYQSVPK
jgi:chemotaxis protein methyltransferase CheR